MKSRGSLFGSPWRRSAVLLFSVCSFLARASDDLTFELLPGSLLSDECRDCDRIPIVRPLAGTFLLAPAAVSGTYVVSSLDLATPGDEYRVSGSGEYRQTAAEKPAHQLDLLVTVNGGSEIKLTSGLVALEADWPVIVITVTDPDRLDPFHVYSLEIRTAPRPVSWVPYALAGESMFIDDCTICGRPTIPIPVTGTFLLGEIDGGGNPIVTYVVRDLDVRSVPAELDYHITGGGTYRQGGEVALLQEMDLLVHVNETTGVRLTSDSVTVPVRFPAIDIQTRHQNPETPMHVYSLRIVADIREATAFRRADANADGKQDISDAVFTLSYLFAQGPPPSCLDAADTNDDGAVDIADPVYALQYLFVNGPAPDEPFLQPGLDPTQDGLDCAAYPPGEQ